jgi:hypothetical protein
VHVGVDLEQRVVSASVSPSRRQQLAVFGMIWIAPRAPTDDTTYWRNRDSVYISAHRWRRVQARAAASRSTAARNARGCQRDLYVPVAPRRQLRATRCGSSSASTSAAQPLAQPPAPRLAQQRPRLARHGVSFGCFHVASHDSPRT